MRCSTAVLAAIVVLAAVQAAVATDKCIYQVGNIEYNMCDLRNDKDYTVKWARGTNTYTVVFNVGKAANMPDADCRGGEGASAYLYHNDVAVNCVAAGGPDTDQSHAANSGEGLVVTFKNGEKCGTQNVPAETKILFVCADIRLNPTYYDFSEDTCLTTISFSTPDACNPAPVPSFGFWDFVWACIKWTFYLFIFISCCGCCMATGVVGWQLAQGKTEVPDFIRNITGEVTARRRARGGVYEPVSAYEKELLDVDGDKEGFYSQL